MMKVWDLNTGTEIASFWLDKRGHYFALLPKFEVPTALTEKSMEEKKRDVDAEGKVDTKEEEVKEEEEQKEQGFDINEEEPVAEPSEEELSAFAPSPVKIQV